ncbi:MAG: chemotaxis protein MotA [Ignavibacteria bacterium]|nr:chemotaxis protein MotA [Ignavibacteria bacterium]MCU7501931.1 chemotaxis protein MotA [Ignavibacteria bacterium]MCU7514723.1 chemotaxis protein MotA [Ignavibacteria bacterium]
MKKLGGINGLILGVFSIFGAFLIEGGSIKALFLLPPLVVVFGGTFAAVIIGFGFNEFRKIFSLAGLAYFPREYDTTGLIYTFIEFSILARKEGLLSLESQLEKLPSSYPKKMVRLLVDGTDAESLQNIAYCEMKSMQERHFSNIFIFTKMGGYAPTMGILGTVMGLVMTLAQAGGDPNSLIHNIASAFIATLWGVFSANLIWLPIGDKLKQCHLEEKHMMEISLEGVLALQSGEIPSVVKARLISMLPQREQEKILAS